MLNNIFLKTLRDQRKPIMWWSLGLLVITLITDVFYPSFKGSTELNELFSDSEILKAFAGGFEDFTSGEGYVNSQLLVLLIPLLLLVYSVRLGTATIAGEERGGTLDVLLANPVSRVSALIQKFGALLVANAALVVVVWIALAIGSAAFDMGLDLWHLTQACISLLLFGWAFGAVAIAAGSATGKTSLTFALASAVGVTAYLMHTFAPLVEGLDPLKYLSPFYYYIGADPLSNGISIAHGLVLLGLTAALLLTAAYTFDRRDLAV